MYEQLTGDGLSSGSAESGMNLPCPPGPPPAGNGAGYEVVIVGEINMRHVHHVIVAGRTYRLICRSQSTLGQPVPAPEAAVR